jgi:CheY-like chemotaxis protein
MDTHSADALRPLRIIYAEDVRELRELARIVLTREGHAVECVEDGLAALAKISANLDGYDLLITDHHMPRMNGLELVLDLRRLPFRGRIMVFSSELNPVVSNEYEKLQVDRILFKPVYPSYLKQAIAELFPTAAVAEKV